jgi:iron complex outermembrane receptor protein
MRFHLKPVVSAAAAACACCAVPALAQEPAQSITVTATKRPQLLIDVPQTVQVLDASKLAAEGAVDFSDVVQLVPGASQTFKASPGFEVLQLRGVSSGAVGDSLVGYYIDEIPFGLPNLQYIPPVNLFDLSRVEVLRGPQGTLYGQSSMGGAIRVITRRPDLKAFGGEVRLGYASVQGGADAQRADAVLNVPVQTDRFGLRISAGTSREDSYIANTGRIANDNVRVKALAQVSEALAVEGTLWNIRSRQADYAYGLPANPYTGITDPREPRGVDTDVSLGNLTIHWSTPVGDLVSATSYVDHEFTYRFALPGLRDFPLLPGSGQWLSDNRIGTRTLTQELRLASRPGGSFDWIAGLFFQDGKVDSAQEQGWKNYKPFGLGASIYTEGTADLSSRSQGLFGEVSMPMAGGKLVPTLGLRLYRDQRRASELRDNVPLSTSRNYSSLNPRLNLAYKPTREQLLFVNVAKGFRSGALQGQAAVAAARAAGLPAELLMPQDSLWSYEAGWKASVGRSLSFEAAVYRIDWKDAQITNLLVTTNPVSGAVTTTTVVTGGTDIEGTGLDIGVVWNTPLQGLSVQLAGNVNQTEFTRVPANIRARVGDQIPGSPKQSASLALAYRTQAAGLDWFANASYNHRGSQSEMITGLSSASITDVRLRLGVGGKGWDASVYGNNLNDQRGVAAVLSAAAVNPIQPRKVGVDLNVRF